jgi:endonuclease-3
MARRVTEPPPPSRALKQRVAKILQRLAMRYPMIGTALDYHDPWELLVATVLSAQTTDENVNRVTAVLFTRYPTAADLAAASVEDVEEIVYSTGFFHQKSAAVIALSEQICKRFDGVVPNELDQLVTLPGVGRKTASVVLAEAFGQPAIAVDTHVSRVSRRLGLTDQTDPAKIEAELKQLVPVEEWPRLSMRMIQFGRDVCDARRPLCGECELNPLCPWPGKTA